MKTIPLYCRISEPVSTALLADLKKVKKRVRRTNRRVILEAALNKFFGLDEAAKDAAVKAVLTAEAVA